MILWRNIIYIFILILYMHCDITAYFVPIARMTIDVSLVGGPLRYKVSSIIISLVFDAFHF